VTDLGDRIAIDLIGTTLSSSLAPEFSGGIGTFALENECVSGVRYSEHGDDLGYGYRHTVRAVLDLKPGCTYTENVAISRESGGVRIVTDIGGGGGGIIVLPEEPIDPSQKVVVIDPGHGGSASGAYYEDVMEKDLTLPMAQMLEEILTQKGYYVVMTRSDDRYLTLTERCEIANAVGADVFVSIHCNAAGNAPNFQGLYTYYSTNSERGRRLAQIVQTATVKSTGAIDRGIANAEYTVLQKTDMPAVLVETGFMSSHEELLKLTDSAYQRKIAQGIANGVVQYLNSPT